MFAIAGVPIFRVKLRGGWGFQWDNSFSKVRDRDLFVLNPTIALTSAEGPSISSDSSTGRSTYVRGARLRPEMPERRSMRLMHNAMDGRALTLNSYFFLSDGSGSESDEEYAPQEEWKKVCSGASE